MKELHKKHYGYMIYKKGSYWFKPLPAYSFWRRVKMAVDVLKKEATVIYY